jgi:hypothetical protein
VSSPAGSESDVAGFHPLRLALLRRCALVPDCTVEERDRILRVIFPELPYEPTMQMLREARDMHHRHEFADAESVLAMLVDQHQAAYRPVARH